MTRETLPERRPSETVAFKCGGVEYQATLGFYLDGRLGEVFLGAGKSGTDLDIATRDAAIACSFALQNGATAEQMRSAFTLNPEGRAEGALGVLFNLLAEAE